MSGRRATAMLTLLLLSAGACSSGTATAPVRRAAPDRDGSAPYPVNFIRSSFGTDSATITNKWWPLTPGTQMIWEGTAQEGDEEVKRKIVFTVTDLTKVIAGVRTLVGWDRDYNNDILAESEIIFLAQDQAGNVWHFGQYHENFDEDGQLAGGRAWLVGYLAGAKAGIMMKANPKPGDPAYSQGFAPTPYNWDDFGRTIDKGEKVCARFRCFTDTLTVEEFEPSKRGQSQLKHYARGIGLVEVGWAGNDDEQEEMQLTRLLKLSEAGMEEARKAALALETRASLYGMTMPLERAKVATTASPSPSPSK